MEYTINALINNRFSAVISPFNTTIRTKYGKIRIGRGSFNAANAINLIDSGTTQSYPLLDVGQFCEFSNTTKIILGGEHIYKGKLVNTFSSAMHIQANIAARTINKGMVKIGHNVVASTNSIILSGAVIGDNTLIGACAVINDIYEGNVLLAGVPARKIKKIDAPDCEWWNLSCDEIINYHNNIYYNYENKYKLSNFHLSLEGEVNEQGRITKYSIVGCEINNDHFPREIFKSKHINYLNQIFSKDRYLTIDDEIFLDLIE